MDASQITFPVGEKFISCFSKDQEYSVYSSGPGSLTAQSKQAFYSTPNSMEKKRPISNKAGGNAAQSRITFCSSTPSNHWLVRSRLKRQALNNAL